MRSIDTTLHEEVVDGQCVVDSWRVSKNSKPFDSTLFGRVVQDDNELWGCEILIHYIP